LTFLEDEKAFLANDVNTNDVKIGPIKNVDAAVEYAIYGWAKHVDYTSPDSWNILFRFTPYGPSTYQDSGPYGSRMTTAMYK